jgi:hypothetical protein
VGEYVCVGNSRISRNKRTTPTHPGKKSQSSVIMIMLAPSDIDNPNAPARRASILSCATFKSITIGKMHSNENEIMAKLKLQ